MEEIKIGFKKYQISGETVEKKRFSITPLTRKNKHFELRKYSSSEEFFSYISRLEKIDNLRIATPKTIKINKRERYVLIRCEEGESALKVFLENRLTDKDFERLFLIYRFCRFAKVDLDYAPQNFLITSKQLIYIGDEIHPQNIDTNLENYGLRMWVDSIEAKNNARKCGLDLDRPILSTAEINKKVVLLSIKNW